MIKLFEYQNPSWGTAFKRISKAFHDYSPSNIQWKEYAGSADVVMVHVVGTGEIPIIEKVLKAGKKIIIVAHIYRTGGNIDWETLLPEAILSVSFHDFKSYFPNLNCNFYSTPWGVDNTIIYDMNIPKTRKILSTGYVADTECLDKLYQACVNTNNFMYHTGKNFEFGEKYVHIPWLNDQGFNTMLNSVQYTSCLRDIEGFEMMGAEGLFCGARPIVPDLPTYDWYEDFGYYVDMQKDIVKQLEDLLLLTPPVPKEDEMQRIRELFDWKNIVPSIFERIP